VDEIPLPTLLAVLAVLLVLSGLFSLAETAMMASNRYRLKHRAARGERGAKLALSLLARTDRLLGVILLGNNLINAASATLTAIIAERLFGEEQWALAAGTVAVTFAILVVSEITPKVIGAAHADRLAPYVSYALVPLLKPPVTWIVGFVNVFVQGVLRLLRIRPPSDTGATLTARRGAFAGARGQYFRGKHRTLLANLFELDQVTVDDVMTRATRFTASTSPPSPRNCASSSRRATHAHAGLRGLAGHHRRHRPHQADRRARAGRRDRRRAPEAPAADLRTSCLRVRRSSPSSPSSRPTASGSASSSTSTGVAGPGDDRGHHRGDHRRVHHHRPGAPRATSARPTARCWSTAWRRCARSTDASAPASPSTDRRR